MIPTTIKKLSHSDCLNTLHITHPMYEALFGDVNEPLVNPPKLPAVDHPSLDIYNMNISRKKPSSFILSNDDWRKYVDKKNLKEGNRVLFGWDSVTHTLHMEVLSPDFLRHRDLESTVTQWNILGKEGMILLDYCKSKVISGVDFKFAVNLDNQNRVSTVFWAPYPCRRAFLSSDKEINFEKPFTVTPNPFPLALPISGLDNNGNRVLFGCGMIFSIPKESIKWLLSTFSVFVGKPKSIYSTLYPSLDIIGPSIEEVLPGTQYVFDWSEFIGQFDVAFEEISKSYPNFRGRLNSIVKDSMTPLAFKESWKNLLVETNQTYNIHLGFLYSLKKKWVPAYFSTPVLSFSSFGDEVVDDINGFFQLFDDKCMEIHATTSTLEREVISGSDKNGASTSSNE